MAINVRVCALFTETLGNHKGLEQRLAAFINAKTQDPLKAFGGSDSHFIADGPIGKTGLKVKHAHLSQDVSVIYRLHGNPATLDLYGLFSHKESGTGNTPQRKIQQNLAKRLSSQDFPPLSSKPSK
jgi:hypothetical protein